MCEWSGTPFRTLILYSAMLTCLQRGQTVEVGDVPGRACACLLSFSAFLLRLLDTLQRISRAENRCPRVCTKQPGLKKGVEADCYQVVLFFISKTQSPRERIPQGKDFWISCGLQISLAKVPTHAASYPEPICASVSVHHWDTHSAPNW